MKHSDSPQGLDVSISRHDLSAIRTPDAPETLGFKDEVGQFGYVHSLETGSMVDGPGVRATLFLAGCMLRCQYCHNPDTWHLKCGTRVDVDAAIERISDFAPALRSMNGGLTLSGGEPLVQIGFSKQIFAAARQLGLHTALDTSGFLGAHADDAYLREVDLVLLDIKSGDPALYHRLTGVDLAPTLRFAERLAALNKPVWIRYVLVPGLTDEPDNIRTVARFVAPMRNVEWVEVLPFHQMGAFKWHALGLDYTLEDKPPCSAERAAQAVAWFRDEGCRAR
ncbi:pyruvate formate-lyase-activating protein [Paraburkholderia unamae]|uniref:Pyruvate formate-lyase-activating protein n=1 Tax=Paraburkholderia unamae TaxID=219649 RepID=A0ACC6RSJ1_9BURK